MSKIKTVDYVVQELVKLGITDVFGLPGDYNFNIVEAVEKNKDTNWIGCTNELNAGYAADGYARIKGYGALVTTYGVGELSAINAIAGSFAEFVPVIKIVGVPKTKDIKNKTLLHHNFSEPDYHAFERAFSNVTCTTAFLDETNAKKEIDRVLSVFINEKKPVYLAIPMDICDFEIENEPEINIKKSDENILNSALNHAQKLLKKAQKPVIIADSLIERFLSVNEAKEFIKTSGYPVTTFIMGQGLVNWNYENYLGTFTGRHGNKNTYDYVNSSDCVISIGAIMSDFNTFNFDMKFIPSNYIQIFGDYTVIENKRYDNVLMKDMLNRLTKIVPAKNAELPKKVFEYTKAPVARGAKLDSKYIYPRIQEFLKKGDVIFIETGMVKYGFALMKQPEEAMFHSQVLWGSIGWATAAAFGASVALKDTDKRVILFTGEGSHQLTAQEVSSVMRYGLKPIFIILNNDGYTIERLLSNDPMASFNDIAQWDYAKFAKAFDGDIWTARAKTDKEFDEALTIAAKKQKTKMCYIEIFTDKMDLPELAKRMVEQRQANKPSIS